MAEVPGRDVESEKAADPERHWNVFVSSTSRGLNDFREAARGVIGEFEHFRADMMEDWGAEDGAAREICVGKVKDCDLLIGIVGIRYGGHPPDDRTSFTEIEYQTAVENGKSRLMYLLEQEVADKFEAATPQEEDRADRQAQFRETVREDRVSDVHITSVADFTERLREALVKWVERDSFKALMVDHADEFRQARARLLDPERTGRETLIFGAPGTGKTKLVETLLVDVPVRRAYRDLIGPPPVRLAEPGAVARARAEVNAQLDRLATGAGVARAGLDPVLVTLSLESDLAGGRDVEEGNLAALGELFAWGVPAAVVIAETNNRQVMERFDRDLARDAGAVVTVGDYQRVDDALEQMRRDAPSVRSWPQPETRILAEAVGLRPISLRTAAKDLEAEARRSVRRVPAHIGRKLAAIASEESEEGKYKALIGHSIESLSPGARGLLALMTVLHPKPTLFPDEMAIALDLSLSAEDAVAIAAAEDDDLDEGQREVRDRADDLVVELVDRGLLERTPRPGPAGRDAPPLLTLHPANVRAIRNHLPLTGEQRREGHTRAEAFYRALVGEAVSGSFAAHFRMEDGNWRELAEEWIYHFSRMTPGEAGVTFAALFLDAYWWWDLYVPFDFCDLLLEYASRPRVAAVSPDMPLVVRLLGTFRGTYPREHDSTLARLHAALADDDPVRAAALAATARQGAGVIDVLRELCAALGITELDPLFAGPRPGPDDATGADEGEAGDEGEPEDDEDADDAPMDQTRLHLLGLICLFLAEGHRFRADLDRAGTGLAAAAACYRRAESCFRAEEDDWDVAWTRYLHGEVTAERGGDPDPLWDAAEECADHEGDTELLANIERARADHLRARGHTDGALPHYGRAVFYGLALQVTSNLSYGADPYTQAFYREMRLHAVNVLAEPLLHGQDSALDARVAEAALRLTLMLAEWGGDWRPDPQKLDAVLRKASRQAPEESAREIGDAAFPEGPGPAVFGKPESRYYRRVNEHIVRTSAQPWVKGLTRWAEQREPDG